MRKYSRGYVTKNRNVWRANLNWQDDQGKQHRITKNTKVRCYPDKRDENGSVIEVNNRGKAAAERFLDNWRDEMVARELSETSRPECKSVSKYVEEFIESREAGGVNSESTLGGYRVFHRHLEGTVLGSTSMSDVTPSMASEWELGLLSSGLTQNTVSHYHVFIKSVFAQAMKREEIGRNPFDLIDAPKRTSKPINSLTAEGIKLLNSVLKGYEVCALSTAARIALMTGMRSGEICALRWQDIDTTNSIIHVNHALSRKRGGYVLATPKTRASRRDIPYGEALATCLANQREKTEQKRATSGLPWDDSLYVIGSPVDGTWQHPLVLSRLWHDFARVMQLKGTQGEYARFHDLRHSFATHAIASGVDVKTVSVILGHSNAAMTLNIYADALDSAKRAGMDKMDGILSSM